MPIDASPDRSRSGNKDEEDVVGKMDPWRNGGSHRGYKSHHNENNMSDGSKRRRDESTGWRDYTRRPRSPGDAGNRRGDVDRSSGDSGNPGVSSGVDLAKGVVKATDVVDSLKDFMLPHFSSFERQFKEAEKRDRDLKDEVRSGFERQEVINKEMEGKFAKQDESISELFRRLTVAEGKLNATSKANEDFAKRLDVAESQPPPNDQRTHLR